MKDSHIDRGNVDPLNHAASMKYEPASHKTMSFWRNLSSSLFLLPLNCESRADASYIKNKRSAWWKYLKFCSFKGIIHQSSTMIHLGCPVLLESLVKVHYYIWLKKKRSTKQCIIFKKQTLTGQVCESMEKPMYIMYACNKFALTCYYRIDSPNLYKSLCKKRCPPLISLKVTM